MSRPGTSTCLQFFINYLVAKVLVAGIMEKYVCVSGQEVTLASREIFAYVLNK